MCVSCGCHEYEDDHGDSKNILLDEVKRLGGPEKISRERIEEAAAAANISVEQAESNVKGDYLAAAK